MYKHHMIKQIEKVIDDEKFLYIVISLNIDGYNNLEYSITPRSNFKDKLEYIKECFDDELINKNNMAVQIANITFFDSLENLKKFFEMQDV